MQDESLKHGYGDTLNLPKTDFSLHANFAQTDEIILQRWAEQKLSEKTFHCHEGKDKFILHDGPPYANGNIHLGHAYNKISKDIIAKFERMSGKHVPIIPGWDCHGLPIELKVTQEHPGIKGQELKQASRAYAQRWIDIQKEEFKKLGVMMHWDKAYTTMSFSYEATIVRAFGIFYDQGFIQKKLKTVPWCFSCQTVLATAEIEYAERKDPSLYVQFALPGETSGKLFSAIENREVSLLVWTTTPWTLPLNRAVVLNPEATYSLVEINQKLVIVGKSLVEKISATVGQPATPIAELNASDIIGSMVHHPFIADLMVPVIGDGFVSLQDGTACVHSAPGCGPEDYEVALKHNLEIYSPLTADGKYSSEIVPQELSGMPIIDGQIWVIKKLAELDRILFKNSIRHSYPHCWRCRNGLIFRATSQWFCDLSQHNLRTRALAAIQGLKMYPETGRNRLAATVEGRLEWCLSRQRSWGVPIPALHCIPCGHVFTSSSLIEKAAAGIEREGIEYWDRVEITDLDVEKCPACLSNQLGKEHDILDVWFESGVSHYAVLQQDSSQQFPASMYLEGKDQHRAWFQSSLLASLVLNGIAPMQEIFTHGFTVDEHGKKMSKSLGNVVSPQDIIKQVGTDGLRLWVASCDASSDPVVSAALLKNISEVYRKIRNTSRFLLSNLYDFEIERDQVAVESMYSIDRYALAQLHDFNTQVRADYEQRNLTAVFHKLADFTTKDLSSFYLDVIKDRLYAQEPDSIARRSAQTVCFYIVSTLNSLMAPILSFTSEQIFDHYKKPGQDSIHLQTFFETQSLFDQVASCGAKKPTRDWSFFGWLGFGSRSSAPCADAMTTYRETWAKVLFVREHILKLLERSREAGLVRHPLDGQVTMHLASELFDQSALQLAPYQNLEALMKELCIVSSVTITKEILPDMTEVAKGVWIQVSKAEGVKCPRCWHFASDNLPQALCLRCTTVLSKRPTL